MAAETFEEQQGSGFWLSLEQRHGPNIMIEVSEKEFRRHKCIDGAGPSREVEVEKDWSIF